MRKIFILFFVSFLFCAYGFAADYCVLPTASGSGDGSSWDNALGWNFTPARGDGTNTYYLAGGQTYGQKTLSTVADGSKVITIKKAVATDSVASVSGWQEAYGNGQVLLSGSIDFRTSYWIVDGSTGTGISGYGIKSAYDINSDSPCGTFSVQSGYASASNIIVRHIEITDTIPGSGTHANWGPAFYFFGPENSGHVIEYIYAHNIDYLFAYISAGGVTIRNNYVDTTCLMSGPSAHCEAIKIDGGGSEFDIYNNFIKDWGNGGQVTGCVVFGDLGTTNVRAYNNIYWLTTGMCGGNGVISPVAAGGVDNLHILNSTFVGCGALLGYGTISDAEAKNNIFMDSSITFFGTTLKSHNYYYNCTGEYGSASEDGDVNGLSDPFINSASGDFRLKSSATAIGAGVDLSATFTTDKNGVTRSVPWDIGAYKYGTTGQLLPVKVSGATISGGSW